ncbi:(R,R)-butanediol dehydrogenase [Termitomyces sp. J132]|nr:(R,R)-butanediol dehydrogenase [Termitomyces sp. J132]
MKAARYYGPGDIRVEDIAEPVASNGQVKVKVYQLDRPPSLSVCGSDLHAYLSPIPIYANSVPNELTGETAPVTLGHEFSGTIVALGPGVDQSKWTVGTNVVVRAGNLMYESRYMPRVCIGKPEPLPFTDSISVEIGACIEPLAVAWHAIKRSGFSAGKSVLILGAGPIGLFILKILRSFDPSATIVMSEPTVLRRQQALKNGATLSLDPLSVDVPEAVTKATGGIGVDIAFDAAGIQASLDTALHSVRPRGTVVNVAVWEKTATVDVNLFWTKEIFLTGSAAYDRVHPELLEAVAAGKIPGIEDLITRRIALEDVVEKGFKALLHNKDAHIKILVRPSGNEKSKL